MPAWFRAGLVAALFVFAAAPVFPVQSAEKTFQDAALDDAAIKLEAELKEEAGTVEKPVIALKKDADAALKKGDLETATDIYVQIVSVAPNDAQAWRQLADLWLKVPTTDDEDGNKQALLYINATTAAYIAHRRSGSAADEANSLIMLANAYGKRNDWRPALNALALALKLHETPELQTTYDSLREKYGFRVSNYSVDSDAASPRACFQFTEALPKRTDFSPFVAVAGQDKPALSVDDQQICVEGLTHGESYAITLREGLPSTVGEALLKTADFSIYVRDRSPFVRLSGKAYVLPKTGQQSIPLVSVNTDAIKVTIYRIGDRNLIDQVLGGDFERNLYGYTLNDIAEQKGEEVWTGDMTVEKELNTDVTTNFPVNEAVRALQPGVYVLAAMPASLAKPEEYSERATQWFIVSDLGLTAYSGSDGVHAFVNSLATTAPAAGVELRLIARNNEVLATKTSDANGRVDFEPGLSRGEGGLSPALLIASLASGDYAFLSLKSSPFDLTDRGVAGRDAPAGLDAYVFTERGVYRTGETVHVTALLRDAGSIAVTGVPLTLLVTRSDGVEYRRNVVPDQGIGGRSLDVPIISSAPTGTWRVAAFTDPKRPAIGEATFLVEDYVADRVEFDLTTTATSVSPATPAKIDVDGRFLYGAPASGLTLDGEINIAKVTELPGFAGYVFGLDDDSEADRDDEFDTFPLADLPETDSTGKASFTAALGKMPASTRPQQAEIVVRMAEAGGRAVERKLTLPITPSAPLIGVKPLFNGKSLGDSDTASFDVVMVAPDGKPVSKSGLRWQLLRVDSKYQWYRSDGYWQYEPIKVTRRVADGTIDVSPDKPGRIAVPVTWGRYRLEVTSADPQGPETTFGFDSGWYAEASADTPDLLEIALDKPEYRLGDSMTVAVTARTAGEVMLALIGDKLLSTTTAKVEAGTAKLPLTVGADWGTGAYVLATLRRPLDVEAKRMPGRAIGVAWFAIDKAAHTVGVALDLPDRIRPQTTLRVPIKLAGLTAGEEAKVVVSAVDVGILNLTNYKAPAPEDYYLGQRKLSAEVRDLYGQLIDGMQGTKGQIRVGGDGGGELQGSPPTQAPLALYSGIVTVGPDGTAETSFDIPAFAGTVRVMAVAWSKDKVGHASDDVIVRDPVVVTATLPRFLLTGDKSTIRLDLDNVEGESGNYQVAIAGDGPFGLAETSKTLALDAKKRAGLSLPVEAKGVGAGTVTVNVTGPGGFALERKYALEVKPSTQILARRTVKPLAPGQTLTLNGEVFADLLPGTGKLALSVTPSAALDVAGLLQALDRYPLGCTEQVISRALPLLYANELSVNLHLTVDTGLDKRIADAIESVLSRQGPEGAFGLWSAGGGDPWLDAYVTDFLTRARDRGFSVPDDAFKLALERLRNYVSTAPDPSTDGGLSLAYALYVLARNGVAPVGDLRYLADAKINDLKTATAKAEVGAALAMLGDRIRAEKVFGVAVASLAKEPKIEIGRTDYGSTLRDAAVVVTLAAEGDAAKPILVGATERVDAARNLVQRTSTQEDAWLVLAARALGKQNVSLNVDEGKQVGPYYATYNQTDIEASDVTITNTGDTPVDTIVTVSGAPTTPEPAAEHGFTLERSFHTLDGEDADVAHARQNQRFVVVLKVTDAQPQFARVALIDYLPAGFEIDNPRLVSSGDTGTLDWIEDPGTPVHTEFRDDRFTAAFNRTNSNPAVFTVAYVVRAVSPGDYVLPQAEIEDMYRPDRFGRTGTGTVSVQPAK